MYIWRPSAIMKSRVFLCRSPSGAPNAWFKIFYCCSPLVCSPSLWKGFRHSARPGWISPPGWSLLPGAPALTRAGLSPARTARRTGRTIHAWYQTRKHLILAAQFSNSPWTGRRPAREASLGPGRLHGFIRGCGHIDGKDKPLAVAADRADVAIDGSRQSEKHLGGIGPERRGGLYLSGHHHQVVGIQLLPTEENLFAVVAPMQHGNRAFKGLTTKNAIPRDPPFLVLGHRLGDIEWADVNLEPFGFNLVRAIRDEATIGR